jgi:hypothetical protein
MAQSKVGRNDNCPCGSGKKYKKCCELKQHSRGGLALMVLVGLLLAAGVVVAISSFTTEPDAGRPTGVWSPDHGHYH